jgi:hypothetical protein
MEMKKLIHKFDITPNDLGLQLNINNLWNVSQNGIGTKNEFFKNKYSSI